MPISRASASAPRLQREFLVIDSELSVNEDLRKPVYQVIKLLVEGKYSELESLTNSVRVTAEDMAKVISGYGRHLALPPDKAFRLMDVVKVRNAEPTRWAITMPLWTQEEGQSDLSVELTVIKQEKGFAIELDDIHVL